MIQFKGLSFNPVFAERRLDNAQNALDAKCIELMTEYTPVAMKRFKNRGKMSHSHRQESPGVIINTEPKARREYYINKGGSGGRRGRYWFDRMVADHGAELERAANDGMKKGGGA